MQRLFPRKLATGDEIRVIAPSESLSILQPDLREIADRRLSNLGLVVTFGRHAAEIDRFSSSSIESRIQDLHDAFTDPNVKGILSVIGGFNGNQLLAHIDWELIKSNPKVFCGYSDITVLNNAFFARTGLVNYSGLHYSTFGQKLHFDYSLDYFQRCCLANDPFHLTPSSHWSDDLWWKNQEDRDLLPNDGWLVINEGEAEGVSLGGHLYTLNLLQGTPYMPDLAGSILFLEDDARGHGHDVAEFDRDLQSVIHQPGFDSVAGLVLGRFPRSFGMTDDMLIEIIRSKKELARIPLIANVDFGHTDPKVTIPIGGTARIHATRSRPDILVFTH